MVTKSTIILIFSSLISIVGRILNPIVASSLEPSTTSVPLTKTPTGLEATVDIPWGHKIKYKFIVDGQWLVLEDQPTEVDPGGYVNNVYTAPPRPITQHIEGVSTNGKAELAETERADSLSQAAAVTGPGFPQSLSDIASTVRDGTSSALGYMASGLGGVVNSFVGIDPINAGQIAISTSKLDPEFDASASPSTVDQDVTGRPILSPETSPGYMTSPVTPLVPIAIVQVNAENKIITSSSSSNL
ncbi:carbohydrate-binding module family 48 protein, partial [Laccaria amethystina LaAM-08-1]